MENRPVGREKRVVSGGSGIKRSGTGLGRSASQRNVKRGDGKNEEKKRSLLGGLFRK